jgi:hypothetical protein
MIWLLASGFTKVVCHPEWLANPVLIRKKNKEWRMCVDYTDLNKHCPKDPFDLPHIDQVVDSTVGCELLCFLDCYSGYHQIPLKEEDQIKTSFITPFGAYCYMTMSFGLKNASATYQRAIQRCLKDQIEKNVEAYVDDVVVKCKTADAFIDDLKEVFATLKVYKWKLNTNKCIFGVPSGILLGNIISLCGIEPNPKKVATVTNMKPPICVKDVQKLTGCMAALSRFISCLGEKVLPFFKLLKAQEKFIWSEDANKAFIELKRFLTSPPIMTAPQQDETLLIYIAVTNRVVSTTNVVEQEEARRAYKIQRPVYFIAKY